MIRLFIAESTPVFAAGLRLALNPDQSRYLSAVMRRTAGDEIGLFNGRDGEWTARIAEVGKRAVMVELTTQTRPQPAAGGPVLAVALVKRAALEYIVEKATELGATRIQLLITRRCNADHTRLDRLQVIAREAAEQTERLDVPEIIAPLKLDSWLADPSVDTIVFGDENSTHEQEGRATRTLLDVASDLTGQTALLIGPEGGFDDAERAALRAMTNVRPVGLGPRILRADTAAIAALTLYQAAAGDWR